MVELGESLAHALKREIREECGIKMEPQNVDSPFLKLPKSFLKNIATLTNLRPFFK